MPIRKCLRRWAAGKARRRLGQLARVWREASYREIPTVEYFRIDVVRHPSAQEDLLPMLLGGHTLDNMSNEWSF